MKYLHSFYTSNEEQQALVDAGLDSFDRIWNLNTTWFEEPNKRRCGWSGVIVWPEVNIKWFIKRQENHNTKTLLHPLKGVPTYQREFKNLLRFHRAGIPTLLLSYYGERIKQKNHQSILITQALNNYFDLYTWYSLHKHNETLVIRIMQKLGQLVRHMHDKKLFHYCLYPNHIFIKAEGSFTDIRLIDLEKARCLLNTTQGRIKDLNCLFRHTHNQFESAHLNHFIDSYLASPLAHADKARRAFIPN